MDTVEYELTNEERFVEALESEAACKDFTNTLIEQTAENIELRLEEKIPQLICNDDNFVAYDDTTKKDSSVKNTIDIGGYSENVNFPALDLEKRFGKENVLEDNLPNGYGMLVFDERCLQLYRRRKNEKGKDNKGFRYKEEPENGILTKPVIRRKLEQENKLLQTENNQLKEQLAQTGQDYQEINEELIQVKEYNQAYQTKINALETQLLNLAKQKLKEIQKVKNLEKYLFRTRGDKETQTELSKTDIEQLQNTVDYYSQTFPNLEKELAKLREKEKDKDQEIRALKLDKGDLLKTVGEKESELLETESEGSLLEYFDEIIEEAITRGEIAIIEYPDTKEKFLAIPKNKASQEKEEKVKENLLKEPINLEFQLLDNSQEVLDGKEVEKPFFFMCLPKSQKANPKEGKMGIAPHQIKAELHEPTTDQRAYMIRDFKFVWTNMERAYGIRHDTLQEKEERASVSEVFSSQANFDANEKKIYRLLLKSIKEYNRIFEEGKGRKLALTAIVANVISLAIFAGYTISMKKDQIKLKKENQAIKKELAEVERVNGKEKRDIAELQKQVAELKEGLNNHGK
ncbi:1435_t:CDS:2 [Paraglomus occultum]|uniref:1435_t:CDS:1 n=1 Tax=Paraglomus occultum TaxID=144539 RepID=A0A9N8VQH0_9GLOM|nr:1435_t:CDS:2 [Paraglomus occultum]